MKLLFNHHQLRLLIGTNTAPMVAVKESYLEEAWIRSSLPKRIFDWDHDQDIKVTGPHVKDECAEVRKF